jgi:hypothetical protein
MTIDHYVAVIDTCILVLLIGWSFMDRMNIYLRKSK